MSKGAKIICCVLAILLIATITVVCIRKNNPQPSGANLENQPAGVESSNTNSAAPGTAQNTNGTVSENPAETGQTPENQNQPVAYTYNIDRNNKNTLKRASLIVLGDTNEFLSHFAHGDLVSVEFDTGEVLQMPVCGSYDDVSPGEILINVAPGYEDFTMATSYGELALKLGFLEEAPESSEFAYQIVESKFPHTVTISLIEKGAYLGRISLSKMALSPSREAYPDLSDEDFANFRPIVCGSIEPGTLYRSSSPIDDAIGRSKLANAAMKANGIKAVINMADSEQDAKKMPGYADTYYSKCNVLFKKMSMSFITDDFKGDIADCLRFIANNDGPYLIHCVYGKDRTGLLCAIIESLCDAGMGDIQRDYLKTYDLLYDVQDGRQQSISSENRTMISETIAENLSYAYGVEVTAFNHHQKTVEYLLSIGLTSDVLEKVQMNLSASAEMAAAA